MVTSVLALVNDKLNVCNCLKRFDQAEKAFLDELISRSGLINRIIMRIYLGIDVRGLDRWRAYIRRTHGRQRLINLVSYWPLRIIERITVFFIGGSLTAAEQATFGRIAGVSDYKLSRYNAMVFGTGTAVLFFTYGEFTLWLSSLGTMFDTPLGFTSFLFYSIGVVSFSVDIWRMIDSYARKRAHMPFGFFPFIINSTTFAKRLSERYFSENPDRPVQPIR
ncbi:MAG TPA: hypothetical protein VJ417_06275 [Candidatus Glassbacteria bacterium]|nr:hypothetical protein [Candidatus Glassbacteria bacterium]